MPEPFLAAARALARHQPDPGSQRAARPEESGIGNGGRNGIDRDRSDARDRLQPAAPLVPAMLDQDIALDRTDPLMNVPQLVKDCQNRLPSDCRNQLVLIILDQRH